MYPSFDIENTYINKVVAGIDEAGRGPLCGPVFAGCVIVNKKSYPKKVNDSKKLTEKVREEIFNEILDLENQGKIFFGIGKSTYII